MTGLVNVAIVVLLLTTGETETREVRYPVNDNVPAGFACTVLTQSDLARAYLNHSNRMRGLPGVVSLTCSEEVRPAPARPLEVCVRRLIWDGYDPTVKRC